MLQKAIHRLSFHRHFWRNAGFDELSEIYAALVVRTMALSVVGIFVPIYLYKLGFSLMTIFSFFVMFFAFRIVADIGSAYVVGRIGPKHTIALSTMLSIAYLSLILSESQLHWPLPFVALLWAVSVSMWFVAINVDFSKIKHNRHGGKELGYAVIFERLGGILGPLIGGLLATVYDARFSIALAIILLILSLVPLFLTDEAVRTRQTIKFKGLPFKKLTADYLAMAGNGFENSASIILWPLLIGVTVFSSGTYAKLGVVTSLGMAATLLFTHMVGVMVDARKGWIMFRSGVWLNAAIHLGRPLLLNNFGAAAASIANDPITTSYRLPLFKGLYDASDSLPGRRIAYLSSIEAVCSFAKMILWIMILTLAWLFDPVTSMQWVYVIVAPVSLLMLSQKFVALKR